jgi:hypothetical protein
MVKQGVLHEEQEGEGRKVSHRWEENVGKRA